MLRILSQNLRGLTAPYDELSTFVLSFNQYKSGVGNDQAIVNKMWSGAPCLIDRKSNNEYGEPLRIPHPFVGITGNMTPSLLPRMHAKAIDDGFFDRWLYCWPDRRKRLTSGERGSVPPHLIASWEQIGWRLFSRPMEEYEPGKFKPQTVHFSDGGRAAWNEFYDDQVAEVNDPDFPGSLQGPWAKLEVYSSRLALILAVLRHASQKKVDMTTLPTVESSDAVDAWRLVDYFKSHHRRVRSFLENTSSTFQPEFAHLVQNWLRRHPDKDEISLRDLTQKPIPPRRATTRRGSTTPSAGSRIGRSLRPKKEKEDRDPSTPGQKPSPVWEVHPEYPREDMSTKYDA